jgi:hypothetical protein
MKEPADPVHSFPSTMHCPHGEHALKHLGGGAFGTSCPVCNPKGDRVALLRNSAEVEAIGAKHAVQATPANQPTYNVPPAVATPINKAAMAAVTILRELENCGVSATLRYESDERLGQARWHVMGTLQQRHHVTWQFSEGQVEAHGDWIAFVALTVEQIRDRLRRKASGQDTKEG